MYSNYVLLIHAKRKLVIPLRRAQEIVDQAVSMLVWISEGKNGL